MEVWHYDRVEKYDTVNNPYGGLFREYIDMFMKQKMLFHTVFSKILKFIRKSTYRRPKAGQVRSKHRKIKKNT